jgi:hypothetical protein
MHVCVRAAGRVNHIRLVDAEHNGLAQRRADVRVHELIEVE